MKNKIFRSFLGIGIFSVLIFSLPSCEEELPVDEDAAFEYALGWLGADEKLSELESDIHLGSSASSTLASSKDLTPLFPPIGNQGQYGTCVTWACGYNLKTYLEGVDNNWSSTQLASKNNQFSPKDLFWAIPSGDKGADCNGSSFESALDVMISRGIATLGTVDYTGLGDCSSSPESAWTTEAANYKLENYRKIDYNDINLVKSYLNDGRPVIIGAQLGNGFMKFNSDDVLTSDDDTYNGQHAYHAMILGGYNDGKQAFRVINSWGTNWGDQGYIWVSYNFFPSFCFAAFVAKNQKSNYNPDPDNDGVVDDGVSGGTDLIGWALNDYEDPDYSTPLDRKVEYDIYNIGDETVYASKRWNILYLYYNAFDANDYGILIYDYYTNEWDNTNHNGNMDDLTVAVDKPGSSANWWNNVDLPANSSIAYALFENSDPFYFPYTMPEYKEDGTPLTGDYYLVLIADGFDDIAEYDEANNYLFFTNSNGDPIPFNYGVMTQSKSFASKPTGKPQKGSKSPNQSVRTKTNVNAYSTDEIRAMIKHEKKTGALDSKIKSFQYNKKKTGKNKGKI